MDFIQTIILSIIEGLTEFLPVSSTGHMILVSSFMDVQNEEFLKTFEIVIQIGAILAIVFMYIKRFLQGITIYLKLAASFIPTAIIGLLAYEIIKNFLFNPYVVAVALIAGGIILILVDKSVVARDSRVITLEDISYKNAFFIGLIQCLSMIPGTSRAAATIIGGVFNGLDKKQATEYSFLLAVPTMFAASGYDLLRTPVQFTQHEIMMLMVGLTGAFIAAWIAVKLFLKIVENYGFKHFGYYRIVIGSVYLLVMT